MNYLFNNNNYYNIDISRKIILFHNIWLSFRNPKKFKNHVTKKE